MKLRYFWLYEDSFKTRFYLIGCDESKTKYRLLKIERTETDENLQIFEDPSTYSSTQIKNLLQMLNQVSKRSSNSENKKDEKKGKLELVHKAIGLIGFIKFTKGYYMILATDKKLKGSIGNHKIFEIGNTVFVPLFHASSQSSFSKIWSQFSKTDEAKYFEIFQQIDLSKNFYFSYTYDLSESLQTNKTKQHQATCYPIMNSFIWNRFLLEPFFQIVKQGNLSTWILPIVHGFFSQKNILLFSKIISIVLLGRRSNKFAGTRYLKRGINKYGSCANYVETEQIVIDMVDTQCCSSVVQMRASIPLYWSQENTGKTVVVKNQYNLGRYDPLFSSSKKHFDELIHRFETPIICLNLIKQVEKHPKEQVLGNAFQQCIQTLTHQYEPQQNVLQYIPYDFKKALKEKPEVLINDLTTLSQEMLSKTGLFIQGKSLQKGIVRINCIDCLDRTNIAQFFFGAHCLANQLHLLQLIPSNHLSNYEQIVYLLLNMYEELGDTIAIQYGGSATVSAGINNRGRTWDLITTLKRYYSNNFKDQMKQNAMNLFLGIHVPSSSTFKLWDIEDENYLHEWIDKEEEEETCSPNQTETISFKEQETVAENLEAEEQAEIWNTMLEEEWLPEIHLHIKPNAPSTIHDTVPSFSSSSVPSSPITSTYSPALSQGTPNHNSDRKSVSLMLQPGVNFLREFEHFFSTQQQSSNYFPSNTVPLSSDHKQNVILASIHCSEQDGRTYEQYLMEFKSNQFVSSKTNHQFLIKQFENLSDLLQLQQSTNVTIDELSSLSVYSKQRSKMYEQYCKAFKNKSSMMDHIQEEEIIGFEHYTGNRSEIEVLEQIQKRNQFWTHQTKQWSETALQYAMVDSMYRSESVWNVPQYQKLKQFYFPSLSLDEIPHRIKQLLQILKSKLEIKDRVFSPNAPKKLFNQLTLFELFKQHVFKNSFVASQAIDIVLYHTPSLTEKKLETREQVVELLNILLDFTIFHSCDYTKVFQDGYDLFRFSEDDCTRIVNQIPSSLKELVEIHEKSSILSMNPSNPIEDIVSFSENLLSSAIKIVRQFWKISSKASLQMFMLKQRTDKDFSRMITSYQFVDFLIETCRLQTLDLTTYCKRDKTIFFINLYNTLFLHTIIICGGTKRIKFDCSQNRFAYMIGGHVYPLQHIKDGILRGNRLPANGLFQSFEENDERLQLYLYDRTNINLLQCHKQSKETVYKKHALLQQQPDSRILFLLSNPLYFINEEIVERRRFEIVLQEQAANFCASNVSVLHSIFVSQFFADYITDFGNSLEQLIQNITHYADSTLKNSIQQFVQQQQGTSIQLWIKFKK